MNDTVTFYSIYYKHGYLDAVKFARINSIKSDRFNFLTRTACEYRNDYYGFIACIKNYCRCLGVNNPCGMVTCVHEKK